MAKPHWPQESPLGWWEHPTAEGKLRLGSSDEVERCKGTQDGLSKVPKVGKAVLPLTSAASREAVKLVFQEFAIGAPPISTEAAREESAG